MPHLSRSIDGLVLAVRTQQRRRHENEVWRDALAAPWGSRRLPRTLGAGDPQRLLFRSLLRRAEGVPVTLPNGESGVVAEVVFPVLAFDFWPDGLIVSTRAGRWRISTQSVSRIDIRNPQIEIADVRTDRSLAASEEVRARK